MPEPARQRGLRWTKTSVRVGTDVAYLARLPGDGVGAFAHLAIVRTRPADALAVLDTIELGPYPVLRPARDCVAGFDGAAAVRVRAWDATARAIVVRYYSGERVLLARVVRWDGEQLGPALEARELARCKGPMHALRVRPRGDGRGPAIERVELQ